MSFSELRSTCHNPKSSNEDLINALKLQRPELAQPVLHYLKQRFAEGDIPFFWDEHKTPNIKRAYGHLKFNNTPSSKALNAYLPLGDQLIKCYEFSNLSLHRAIFEQRREVFEAKWDDPSLFNSKRLVEGHLTHEDRNAHEELKQLISVALQAQEDCLARKMSVSALSRELDALKLKLAITGNADQDPLAIFLDRHRDFYTLSRACITTSLHESILYLEGAHRIIQQRANPTEDIKAAQKRSDEALNAKIAASLLKRAKSLLV